MALGLFVGLILAPRNGGWFVLLQIVAHHCLGLTTSVGEVKPLVREGMEPHLARAEVLGLDAPREPHLLALTTCEASLRGGQVGA